MKSQKLTKAFIELRKLGYFAKRSLACCQSCSLELVPESHACLYVFTHDQDEYKGEGVEVTEMYLGWSAPEDDPSEIVKVLKKHGLKVKHDGSPQTRILVSDL